MLQRCSLAASPAVVLRSDPRGGKLASAVQQRTGRAAVCSAESPLLPGFAARQHASGARLRSVPPSSVHPWSANKTALPLLQRVQQLLQRCRANAIVSVESDGEEHDTDRVILAAAED